MAKAQGRPEAIDQGCLADLPEAEDPNVRLAAADFSPQRVQYLVAAEEVGTCNGDRGKGHALGKAHDDVSALEAFSGLHGADVGEPDEDVDERPEHPSWW